MAAACSVGLLSRIFEAQLFPIALTWSSSTTNLWPTRNTNMLRMWTVMVVGGGVGVGVGVVEQNRVTADPLIQTLQLRGAASCQQAYSSIEDSRDTLSAGAIIPQQSRFHRLTRTPPSICGAAGHELEDDKACVPSILTKILAVPSSVADPRTFRPKLDNNNPKHAQRALNANIILLGAKVG
ncbi:hypothetical protein BDN71DRAFT_1498734 [Pleurotus eryngii]|uniref:Uncharacterized protein n=1 Tax=Pleurotus eryngii TaxID=5323 RepID=A0A9P5ZQL7_PLEER|nr:hypothetical protein BDN71DRAFT_1498734 [Pleurotus eryngii]